MERFAKREKLRQTILLEGADVAKEYKTDGGVPTTLWIDREGVIADTDVGYGGPEPLDEKTARLISPSG